MNERKMKRKIMYELISEMENGDEEASKKINKLMDDSKWERVGKPVIIIYKNGERKLCRSINSTSKYLGIQRETVLKHLINGTATMRGIRFEYVKED